MIKWPWRKREPRESVETQELREKLEQVRDQGDAVRELHRRARKIIEQNHLAADIRRALGGSR